MITVINSETIPTLRKALSVQTVYLCYCIVITDCTDNALLGGSYENDNVVTNSKGKYELHDYDLK